MLRRIACGALLMITMTGCGTKDGPASLEAQTKIDTSSEGEKGAAGGKVVEAGLRDGKPVGLFFMTRFWSFTGTLEKAAWYFTPEGDVYRNLETGFSPQDLAAYEGQQGKYTVSGDTMTVTWSDGKTTESAIEREGQGFMWDGGIFSPVKPIQDKARIAGEYEGGESLSVGGDRAAVSKSLELRPDGTFVWSGVAFVSGTSDETEVTASSESASSGTWAVKDYSIEFTNSDGTVLRQIAFPYDDEETEMFPDWLYIGGTMFKRQ